MTTPGTNWRKEKRKIYAGGARDKDFDALTPRGLPLERGPGARFRNRIHLLKKY